MMSKRLNIVVYLSDLVPFSILCTFIIFCCFACGDAERTTGIVTAPEDAAKKLPAGEGLDLGALAPEFSLPDGDGEFHTLSEYRGQKLVIVFYRTGTWGDCRTQLGELQEGYEDMQAEGAELIAISADPITTVNSTQQTLQITYVLLSDKETKTIGAYNVVDPSEIEVARPAVYIVNQDGNIAWKYLDAKRGKRIGPEPILAQLKKF